MPFLQKDVHEDEVEYKVSVERKKILHLLDSKPHIAITFMIEYNVNEDGSQVPKQKPINLSCKKNSRKNELILRIKSYDFCIKTLLNDTVVSIKGIQLILYSI